MKCHTDKELFNSILRVFLLLHEKKKAKRSCLVMLCQVKLLGVKKSHVREENKHSFFPARWEKLFSHSKVIAPV